MPAPEQALQAGQIPSFSPSPTPVPTGTLFEPGHDGVILLALECLYRGDYASADSILSALPDCPARAYFRGLVGVNRFDDLGDTSALFAAEALWERVDRAADSSGSIFRSDANFPLYRGLSGLQLSYVASVTGGRIRAARLGRKAVGLLRPLAHLAEAEAALALYDYYKATMFKGVDWVPFVIADKQTPLKRLEAAIPRSRYLREILRTSLLWLYYDASRYEDGLKPIEAFLVRFPRNRSYRQMRADFRYRKRDLDSALAIHQKLASEYLDLGRIYPTPAYLPLGYLSSVGNLAKIYASKKQQDSLEWQLAIWHSPRYRGMMKWLPASLKREVEALKK
ncbi:MAG: hypothetical protein M3Y08_12920 [Fibrobacterota bacterium]|nr:hypothetical protein [Fibrobacterota bacterium]